ncbi:MAG: hypothetical protein ACK58L_18005 [Planctomycetota bacterium]
MNYLAHGYRFLDDPHKLAGTAVPDWLSVVDRRVRVRSRRIMDLRDSLRDEDLALADGMLQHLQDDDAFHRSETFLMLESDLSSRFRRIMPDAFDHRPGFLGHIVVEILLDATISERDPSVLPRYYDAMRAACPDRTESLVNRISSRSTDRLAYFIRQFQTVQFLFDYSDDVRLLGRLNQVMRRVTLPLLDESSLPVLQEARRSLRFHVDDLLHAVENGTVTGRQ